MPTRRPPCPATTTRPPSFAAASLLVMMLATTWPTDDAQAQTGIRRCTAADGTSVYTDRACTDIDATARLPDRGSGSGIGTAAALRRPPRSCAASLQELVHEMTFAIDAQDVNRLAGLYHWVGVSSRSSHALMDRLQVIVRRPLVDIAPVYPAPREPEPVGDGDFEVSLDAMTSAPRRAQAASALRVEQTLANSATPSRTVFGLRRHMDCWWVTL